MIFSPSLKVKNLIGEGLNAVVYQAELKDSSLNINKRVAFKVLKRREDIRHFKKELSNLMQVSGKRLVKCYGWRRYQGKPGLILEYVEGVSLYELQQAVFLNEDEKAWILNEVLNGIKELKDCDLFHGDLSPKNIMISQSGQIKLIDFGMTNWRTKLVEATPGFISPLVLNGGRPSYDTDLDSFSALKTYLEVTQDSAPVIQQDQEKVQKTLGLKIMNLIKPVETETFLESPQTEYKAKKNKSFRFNFKSFTRYTNNLTIFTLVFLVFVSPAKISLAKRESGFFIRSKSWMAVKKSEDSNWCYTPCRLSYENVGKKKLFFKTSSREGKKEIILNQVGYLHLDQSDFN